MKKHELSKLRKNLLNNPTYFELLFRKKLRLWNISFKFQKIMCGYIADFYLPQYHLVVEIDGEAHYTYKVQRDKKRDDVLRAAGYEVLRIRNVEVYDYQKDDLLQIAEKFVVAPVITDRQFMKNYMSSLH